MLAFSSTAGTLTVSSSKIGWPVSTMALPGLPLKDFWLPCVDFFFTCSSCSFLEAAWVKRIFLLAEKEKCSLQVKVYEGHNVTDCTAPLDPFVKCTQKEHPFCEIGWKPIPPASRKSLVLKKCIITACNLYRAMHILNHWILKEYIILQLLILSVPRNYTKPTLHTNFQYLISRVPKSSHL